MSVIDKFDRAIRELRAEGIEPDADAIAERVLPWLSEQEKDQCTRLGLMMQVRDDVADSLERVRRNVKGKSP